MQGLVSSVNDTLETYQPEVQDREGTTYSLRIRPYRTRDSKIDGVGVTLADIDAIKKSILGSAQSSRTRHKFDED